MAAQTWVLEAGSTFDGAAMTSAVAFSYDIGSSTTALVADGARHVLKHVTDQINANIRVECLDQSLASNAKFYAGKTGILVLKCKLRGSGSTTSTVGTCTFSECVFVGFSNESPNDSSGRIVMNFVAASSNDTAASLHAWS